MKNIYLWIVITITCTTIGLSQEQIPEIVTPTPEAAALGKYGNTPVSKYTGVPNISIPLYTIVEGDISIPITLNYHAGGFKVQEEATWVGLGWSLSTGGTISRDQRGGADLLNPSLSPMASWGQNNILPDAFISSNPNVVSHNLYGIDRVFDTPNHKSIVEVSNYFLQQNAQGDYLLYDFQADHFRYSYPGGAGEFYNQDESNYVSLTKNLIKIENTTSNDFKITDDNGFSYFYGGNLATEYSYNYSIINSQNVPLMGSTEINFHLTNITSKNGNTVNYFYTKYGASLSTVSVKQSKMYHPNAVEDLTLTDLNYGTIIESYTSTNTSTLNKIDFTHGYVQFIVNDETINPRLDLAGDGSKILEAIEVYRYNSSGVAELVKRIVFEYSYFIANTTSKFNPTFPNFNSEANSKRLRLDKVKEYGNDPNSLEPKKHTFYYNSIELPHKTSYSVDKYGYYNGATNSTFLPKIVTNPIENIKHSGANVNPNKNYITANLLEKIVYPTKGTSNFLFEPNTFKVPYVDKDTTLYNASVFDNYGGSPNNDISNANGSFTINHKQSVNFKIHLTSFNTSNVNFNELYVEVNNTDNTYYKKWDLYPVQGDTPCSGNTCVFEVSIVLYPGDYFISTNNSTGILNSSQSAVSIATSTVEYTIRDYNNHSEIGPGVRIAEIINKNFNGSVIRHKKYEYREQEEDGSISSSGRILYKPIFLYYTHEVEVTYNPQPYNFTSYFPIVRYYRTNRPRKSFSTSANGKMMGYNRVIEQNLNSFGQPNGQVISDYINIADNNQLEGDLHGQQNFPSISSPLNGKLIRETIYNNVAKVSFKEYNYEILSSNIKWYGAPYPFALIQKGVEPNYGPYHPLGLDTFPLCLYPEISTFVGLESTTETIYDANDATKYVSITKNYEYENTQMTKESTTASNGKTINTNYFYPLTTNKPAGSVPQKMIDKNILSIPVASTTEVDNEIVSTTATNFKVWHGYGTSTIDDDIILPEKILSLKGVFSSSSQLEDKIEYHDYDANGNPLQVSKTNGPPISYVWGYGGMYPIAKVENATQTQISGVGLNTTLLNNSSTSDAAMRTELNNIRTNLPNAMVTTYTYEPMVGVTSVTDPRGNTMTYHYDSFNRLEFVKDKDGNLVSENKYHYKNQ